MKWKMGMVQILRPEIQLKSNIWTELSQKYKLNGAVSDMRLQAIWRQMQRCWQPAICYLQDAPPVIAAATLGIAIEE